MSRYRITFQQEHVPESERLLVVPTGTRLDEATVQAGFGLRTHCDGAGTCGKCQLIVNGQKKFACQVTVESDLNVIVPLSSLRTEEHNIVIQTASSSAVCRLPSAVSKGYGIAVDIGTTTLAAELHDFSGKLPVQTVSCANPQRKFGDDVMTRIRKVMEDASALSVMQKLIVGAINEMTDELTEQAGIRPNDVSAMVASGNTVMQSLLFGIDPSPLGESPFHAPVSEFPPRQGSEIGLNLSGTVEALPIFGGFVGGDIVAGMLALMTADGNEGKTVKNPLASSAVCFLDIGTNGEIVLAHRGQPHQGKLSTAATAAGPAFEGATIECGTIAVPGAIEHVQLESGKLIVSTIGNQPAIGICGSGLLDAVAVLLEQGIIQPNGRFADKRSSFKLVSASASGIGEAIVLTQRDIRELQLAAGAIRAGITLLLQENNVLPEQIEMFYVAGGFGQSIRLSSARRIGLLPALPAERFQFCGNTSLAGARAVLLNPDNVQIARRLVQQSHHCELAMLPQFQKVFAESMLWNIQ